MESSDKKRSTGGGNGKPLRFSCLENPMCPPLVELPDPGIKQTCVSCIARGFFTTEPLGKPIIFKYETLIKQVLGEGKPIVTFQWRKKSSSVNVLSISKKLNNDVIITFLRYIYVVIA